MSDQQDPLTVRLERRGFTHRPARVGLYQREVVDADGQVVFCGSALDCSRWVNAGCEPEMPRERRPVETDPPGVMPLAAVEVK